MQNFHVQSKQWKHTSTRMERKEDFAALLRKDDRLISFDIRSGYRHFRDMRDYFLFHFDGRYYRCKALPFGWGRSSFWFTNLVKPFVIYLREVLGMRLLPYMMNFWWRRRLGGEALLVTVRAVRRQLTD